MEILYATCVSHDGKGILLRGPSGSGKSDLALRLIDRGGLLVADDRVELKNGGNGVWATLPQGCAQFAGALEIRGIGILSVPHVETAIVNLVIELGETEERLPVSRHAFLDGSPVRSLCLSAFEASTAAKIVAVLQYQAAHVTA